LLCYITELFPRSNAVLLRKKCLLFREKNMSKKFLLSISFVLVLSLAYTGYGSVEPNKPKPTLKWYDPPTAMGPYAITMGVTIAVDGETPPVWYYFECTSDATKSSGWIRCTDTPGNPAEPNGPEPATYTATDLTPQTQYSFRVKACDSYEPNSETSWTSTLSVKTDAFTTPPVIRLDINPATDNNDANTQVGFAGFQPSYSGNEANDINGNPSGVIIDLGGNIQVTRRVDPCGIWTGAGTPLDPCLYQPRAGERIYRDFISGIQPSGVEITLWGLGDGQDCNVTIWAFDSQITGDNRVAKWYANGEYIFDTNFGVGGGYWPAYVAVLPGDLYKHAYSAQVTADKFGRIVLSSERNPISPSDQPFAFVNALQVEPNALTTFVPTKYAHRPVPFDGTEGVPVNALLTWKNGDGVSVHDLYLDTDFNNVNTGSPSCEIFEDDIAASSNEGYDPFGPIGFLKLETTYYWRVDEDNTYTGEVWSFMTGPNSVVDNFNRAYTESQSIPPYRLRDTWKDYFTQSAPQTRATIDDVAVPNEDGPMAMQYDYLNYGPPFYAEARATIGGAAKQLNIDPDWLGMDAKSLTLRFYGQADNDANEQMYVKLKDAYGVVGKVNYPDNPQIREEWWHEWNIALQDFVDDNNVDLSNVAMVTIGFGEDDGIDPGDSPTGTGTVYFDNIQLYTTRCALQERLADFAKVDYAPLDIDNRPGGDCRVDYRELEVMQEYWLNVWDPWQPPPPNLVAYWPMEEGTGNKIYTDPCDPHFTGTFSSSGVTWATPGVPGKSGDHTLYFDGKQGTRVDCGSGYYLCIGPTPPDVNAITLSVWVKWLGRRIWDVYLTSFTQGLISKESGWDEPYVVFKFELDTGGSHGGFALRHFASGEPVVPDLYSPNGILIPYIGRWVHLAATYPHPSGNPADANSFAKLYLNGIEVASGPWRFSNGDPCAPLIIGNSWSETVWPMSPEAFYGYLDEPRIYNRALTADEIMYLASREPPCDLYSECEFPECPKVIDFKDYAVLMEYWLKENMFP
jgi:hypothetical protein